MNHVLGLSLTTATIRWVLVEGSTGDGAAIDRGSLDVDDATDVDGLLDAILAGDDAAEPRLIHAIGVTWAFGAEVEASAVLNGLSARGLDNVVAVSDVEAVETLASGLADLGGYGAVAVCVVEPDGAVAAVADATGVTAEGVEGAWPDADAVGLAAELTTIVDRHATAPDAIFVLGSSARLDPVVAALTGDATAPVFSASEAAFALARGAALTSGSVVDSWGMATSLSERQRVSPTRVLSSVLAAALVTFVASVSLALGLRMMPGADIPRVDTVDVAVSDVPAAGEPTIVPVSRPASAPKSAPVVVKPVAVVAPKPTAVAPSRIPVAPVKATPGAAPTLTLPKPTAR